MEVIQALITNSKLDFAKAMFARITVITSLQLEGKNVNNCSVLNEEQTVSR